MKKQPESFDYICYAKPTTLIIFLLNNRNKLCISDIAKQINCTYAHSVKILQNFKEEGCITTKKSGRVRYVELTDKGTEIAKSLQSIKKMIQQ